MHLECYLFLWWWQSWIFNTTSVQCQIILADHADLLLKKYVLSMVKTVVLFYIFVKSVIQFKDSAMTRKFKSAYFFYKKSFVIL